MKYLIKRLRSLFIGCSQVILLMGTSTFAQNALRTGFVTPPQSAQPRVWWHWMNGNVTKNGITKDLEWMKRVGIGGMQLFEASLNTPVLVDKPVVYLTPEWKEAVRHTAAEASRLGLEFTMSAAGGWSQSGGPMVTAEEAMKKVVWSETTITGGKRFSGQLPAPPSSNGTFLDIPTAALSMASLEAGKADPTYYKDSKVIAYRLPETERQMADLNPVITASSPIDPKTLSDGKLSTTTQVSVATGTTTAYIQFEFPQPFNANAISMALTAVSSGFLASPVAGQVLVSNDGKTFSPILTFPGSTHRPAPQRTYSFPETTARFFRVEFRPIKKDEYDIVAAFLAMAGPGAPSKAYNVAELALHNTPRVNLWEEKAVYGLMFDYQIVPTPPATGAIAKNDVVDLTTRMKADGTLDWDVPTGRWTILRLGYSLTGQKNAPAPPPLTGLEVDKLNKTHVTSYLDKYFAPYLSAMGGKKPDYVLFDSWEANTQNWTDEMLAEFKKRNGYEATPYLPVLTGRVVGSADQSDRFLWDFRTTISDLLADNHYSVAADYLHQKGIKVYGEAIGAALGTLGEGLKSKGRVDIPMCEFWTESPDQFRGEHPADVWEAASAAHIYDKNIVACESFTDIKRPFGPPSYLKYLADHYMALGVNRFVIHTSVHQPLDDKKPGFTLALFGQHYTRQNTWAEQSLVWNRYLARSSYLLQQGKSVNDIAYFIGEDAPVVAPFWEKMRPAIPDGYKADLVNKEVILTRMTVQNGRLVLPDGVSYRVLVLPDKLEKMTLPLLRKIRDLVAAGAIVSGPKPGGSPSLIDFPVADSLVRTMAGELWGMTNGRTITSAAYENGRVYWGKPLADVLTDGQTPADLSYSKPNLNTNLSWIHRRTTDADIYFVANQQFQPETVTVQFRVTNKVPQLWDSDKGTIEPISYTIANGMTTVPLYLEPYGSRFVVFSEPTTTHEIVITPKMEVPLKTLIGSWKVSFPPLFDNTTNLTMNRLTSWTESADSTIRYFSGTAQYTTTFTLTQKELARTLMLDLGSVREIAEVRLNGTPLGILWRTPFAVDITKAAKVGTNTLEVRVTNLWNNRMEGDRRAKQKNPAAKQYTFATNTMFGISVPMDMVPSGLLGPVQLFSK